MHAPSWRQYPDQHTQQVENGVYSQQFATVLRQPSQIRLFPMIRGAQPSAHNSHTSSIVWYLQFQIFKQQLPSSKKQSLLQTKHISLSSFQHWKIDVVVGSDSKQQAVFTGQNSSTSISVLQQDRNKINAASLNILPRALIVGDCFCQFCYFCEMFWVKYLKVILSLLLAGSFKFGDLIIPF